MADAPGRRKHDACPGAARVLFCPACQQPLIRKATRSIRACASSVPRVHNLRGVDVAAPRDALVAFTGISGSGKSSLAFGTIYAEAQRRYFESVAPYARRLLLPTGAPKVDDITGLPPAVALQQRRGSATSRSTVGTVTTLSNLLRMLFSRAGTYPRGATERLDSDAFSPNTAVGACPECHGLGRIHQVTEQTLVPDPSLTIREGAVAAWPGAWQGQNLRDILITLGYDIDKPWRKLPKRQRDWILFTDEQPTVEIDPEPASGHRGLLLQRHLLQRRAPRPPHAGQLAERDDAPPRPAVRRQRRLPGVRRLGTAARGAGGDVRRPHHRRATCDAAGRTRRRAAPDRGRKDARGGLRVDRIR